MSMTDWARREVEIACAKERGNKDEGEWDYGCACYESALKAYESLMEDGHSGFSISMTKQILNRLIEGKPLTPIEDTDDVWNDVTYGRNDGTVHYQCKRMSSLFKQVYKDGTVEYRDVNRVCCVDEDHPTSTYHSGFVDKIIDEMYPIKMPYNPYCRSFKVFCRELLTDRKNGDFNTVAVLRVELPNGTTVDINRYFAESGFEMKEISLEEYKDRESMHNKRIEKENEND